MVILRNISLKKYNTFQIDAKAAYFFEVEQLTDLESLMTSSYFQSNEHLVLGGGSNMLLTDDFSGLVIKMNIKGIEVVKETSDSIWVEVKSGENWHDFVTYCVQQNWSGIENLALIPGCIGAAPIQNIGAYGVELKDVFESLTFFDFDKAKIIKFNNSDCSFGYRDSIFKSKLKGKGCILSVCIKLSKQPQINIKYGAIQQTLTANKVIKPTIKNIYEAVIAIRSSKLPDPAKIGNAGSFFKNPELLTLQAQKILDKYPNAPHYIIDENFIKIPAGWLIEQCGWKGYRDGPIGVHDKQALVLVNEGGGQGKNIENLAYKIIDDVRKKFGIQLTPEVNII